jgi:hypothetical protein
MYGTLSALSSPGILKENDGCGKMIVTGAYIKKKFLQSNKS